MGALRRIIRETVEEIALKPTPAWEALPRIDQIASEYSDAYKDRYGIRPHHVRWDEMSEEEAEEKLRQLYDEPLDPVA